MEMLCLADETQFLRGRCLKKSGSFKQQQHITSAYFSGAMQSYPRAGFSPLAYSKGKKKKALLWKIKTVARKFSVL